MIVQIIVHDGPDKTHNVAMEVGLEAFKLPDDEFITKYIRPAIINLRRETLTLNNIDSV